MSPSKYAYVWVLYRISLVYTSAIVTSSFCLKPLEPIQRTAWSHHLLFSSGSCIRAMDIISNPWRTQTLRGGWFWFCSSRLILHAWLFQTVIHLNQWRVHASKWRTFRESRFDAPWQVYNSRRRDGSENLVADLCSLLFKNGLGQQWQLFLRRIVLLY